MKGDNKVSKRARFYMHWSSFHMLWSMRIMLVLLAPAVRGMHSMLRICEKYANEFDVIFNISKSKCVMCPGRGAVHHCHSPTFPFTTCGNVIEIGWPHWVILFYIVGIASLVRLIMLFASLVTLTVLPKPGS